MTNIRSLASMNWVGVLVTGLAVSQTFAFVPATTGRALFLVGEHRLACRHQPRPCRVGAQYSRPNSGGRNEWSATRARFTEGGWGRGKHVSWIDKSLCTTGCTPEPSAVSIFSLVEVRYYLARDQAQWKTFVLYYESPGLGKDLTRKVMHGFGELSMARGKSQMGRNGKGLTGVQRVLDMRERMKEHMDPCKVMVSNLDFTLTEKDIADFCKAAGEVVAVKIVRRRNSRKPKGYAFVDYQDPIFATIAIDDLTGTELLGRKVEVKAAITKREAREREAYRRRVEKRLEAARMAALEGSGGEGTGAGAGAAAGIVAVNGDGMGEDGVESTVVEDMIEALEGGAEDEDGVDGELDGGRRVGVEAIAA